VLDQAAVTRVGGALALACALLVGCHRQARPLGPMPEPRVVDLVGLQAALAAQRGHPTVVNFWASWCGPCIEEFPTLVRAAEKLRPRGVRFVSVSADDPSDLTPVRAVLERFGAPFDAVLVARGEGSGGNIIDAIDPGWSGALPATFLYDAGGAKVRKRMGTIDERMLAEWVTPLTAPGK
jgi:thiol-disulfide isomerase/thioredoxin